MIFTARVGLVDLVLRLQSLLRLTDDKLQTEPMKPFLNSKFVGIPS